MKSKKKAGMGIGSITDINYAMLTKWWWRFKSNPNQLWAKAIAAVHNNGSVNHLIPLKKSIPGLWKDIGNMESELDKVGINIHQNLVEENGNSRWRNSTKEQFSVKQVRKDIKSAKLADAANDPKYEWNRWAPPKGSFLLWRTLLGRIAARECLDRRGVVLSDISRPRCGLEVESPDHIFIKCLWPKSIWWNVLTWVRIRFPNDCGSLSDFMNYVKECPGGRIWKCLVNTIVIATVWRIWSARNTKVFDGCFIPIMKTVELIKEDSFLWISYRSRCKKPKWENWVSFDVVDIT
ncbi:uncharacterized protein LOC110882626 [Helianthus annuus]|uniref:uncharacterized protein LOC110882626 n=1 Tax=Helianthus annuus TaxID=4232 RepID=UPI000B8FD77A|nr:uncharacterized protein LOC110882626 [Helianthus annuus]